jgi:hypothetical protein
VGASTERVGVSASKQNAAGRFAANVRLDGVGRHDEDGLAARTVSAGADDDNDAAGKWLAAKVERNRSPEVEWSPWRPFEREFTSGWERDGKRTKP